MELPDIEHISALQTELSNLTGLYISLYGEKGNIILPPCNENALLSAVRSSSKGMEIYHAFFKDSIKKVIQRNDVSMFTGPAGEHHFFFPVRAGNSVFVVAGGGVFLSQQDFEHFIQRECQQYSLFPRQIKSFDLRGIIRGHTDILDNARHMQSLFSLTFRGLSKSIRHEKRFRLMKTMLSLISDINLEARSDEIYDILTDTILFFFNADSISVMIRENSAFIPVKTAGRMKDTLHSLQMKVTGILSEVVEKKIALYSDSVIDILRLGLHDDVISIHVFPVIYGEEVSGLLCIFNSEINKQDEDIISELCRIAGFIFRLAELQRTYARYIREINILTTATERINPVKEPDMLYETILETSVHLAGAEKGSLMLMEDETSCLTVKAAKGINKRLLSEIRIKSGEGIAGQVFREGMPLLVDDIETDEKFLTPRRTKYRTGSFMSIPLKVGDKTIGVLNISDKITGEVFSGEDLVLLRSFASYATIALERSTYYSLAEHLRELSITDSLTGLFNRRYFEERFYEELHRSTRHNLSFSLAMLDIDDFKQFNDTEGHLAGDELLKSVAHIAKESLRVIDVIARFGGEEFAVIMPQTDREEALLVAERIRQSIKEQILCTWNSFPRDAVTITIGISTFPHDGKDRKELIRNADKALYAGKMSGKDKTVVWGVER